ncbi:MAG: 1,2-phenylacetyl-CoA epoxidase subunit PaaC [Rhodospirillaceae bacterium]|nr:phenylacetate-CoA oxygenase subunit PaaC [Rhodospirillaceae bacterium]
MTANEALFDYALRLGDDALILSQRLGEWCGHAPAIETDLTLTNVALDLIGQAMLLLGYAGEVEGKGRDADKLAFHRDATKYRNCLLVEQPNGDFGRTIARQFIFSTYQRALYQELTRSSDRRLAEIAAKALKETIYHADLAAEWVIRLGDGTEESHERMKAGFEWYWRFVEELFTAEPADAALIGAGIAVDPAKLRAPFDAALAATFAEATLALPKYPRPITGGRKGRHSEHLGHLLAEMQFLPRAYPDAVW